MRDAVLRIPLWKEFYNRWKANLPNGNFWADLAKITGLEAPNAQSIVEMVRKAYLDDVRYLSAAYLDDVRYLSASEEKSMDDKVTTAGSSRDAEMFSFPGGIKVILPKENMKDAWRKTKQTIDVYLGEENTSTRKS